MMFLKPDVRKSLLAKMLSELLDTRVMVKGSMKAVASDRVSFNPLFGMRCEADLCSIFRLSASYSTLAN